MMAMVACVERIFYHINRKKKCMVCCWVDFEKRLHFLLMNRNFKRRISDEK